MVHVLVGTRSYYLTLQHFGTVGHRTHWKKPWFAYKQMHLFIKIANISKLSQKPPHFIKYTFIVLKLQMESNEPFIEHDKCQK